MTRARWLDRKRPVSSGIRLFVNEPGVILSSSSAHEMRNQQYHSRVKPFYMFISLFVIAALVAPFFLEIDGKPLMRPEDALPNPKAMLPTAEPAIYRWQDADGVWQFSETPPANGGAEKMSIRPNIDPMPATKLPTEAEPVAACGPPGPAAPSPLSTIPGIGGLLQGKELMHEAQAQADALEKRGANMDETLKALQQRNHR